MGTPAYVAPERLEGMPGTARSDLFSVGVVMYEALTGAKPFSGATSLATAQAVLSGQHEPLDVARPGLPPSLVATVERALRPAPEDRFATAADMVRSLDGSDAADDVPTQAPTRRASGAGTAVLERPPAPRRAGLRPWAVPLGVLALVVVLVVALGLLTRDEGPAGVTSNPRPATAPAGGTVPEELDRAITRLEESVRP